MQPSPPTHPPTHPPNPPTVVGVIAIPMLYRPVKWYYVLVAYVIAPIFALPNAYGAGLTDWDNCSMVLEGGALSVCCCCECACARASGG